MAFNFVDQIINITYKEEVNSIMSFHTKKKRDVHNKEGYLNTENPDGTPFKLTWYQLALYRNLDKFKRAIVMWGRRAGKDITTFSKVIDLALSKSNTSYWYLFPTRGGANRSLWSLSDGFVFINLIPKEFVENINLTERLITLTNGSQIRTGGCDHYSSSKGKEGVGSGFDGIVISEYAKLKDENIYAYLEPMLSRRNGFLWLVTTPQSYNHFEKRYRNAVNNPAWLVDTKTVVDCGMYTLEQLKQKSLDENIPWTLIEQEYLVRFVSHVEGATYSTYIKESHIKDIDYDPTLPVYTAWDIGMHDDTAIWIFQIMSYKGQSFLVFLDYMESNGKGVEYYIGELFKREYSNNFARHFFPHDIAQREYTTGLSRLSVVKNLIRSEVTMLPRVSPMVNIEIARLYLQKNIIIFKNTLEEQTNRLRSFVHGDHSNPEIHLADAFRYAVQGFKTFDFQFLDGLSLGDE